MIKAIFAIDAFGGMGFNNKLPWPPCTEDFRWFQTNTTNHAVVMGRKTWESKDFPKPLPHRRNIVVCTNRYYRAVGADVWTENWLERLQKFDETMPQDIFVIGGPGLLEQAKPYIKEFYVTRFKSAYRTDVKLDTRTFFEGLRCRTVVPSKEGNQCSFEVHIPWSNT